MLKIIPSESELKQLLGEAKYNLWIELCEKIDCYYDMENILNRGGKKWDYEYKYRRGGKTLCGLYAKENCFGFMVILGKAEREKFENEREDYSLGIQSEYDNATTYHDGKWIMFDVLDNSMFDDFIKLLKIKRRPNK